MSSQHDPKLDSLRERLHEAISEGTDIEFNVMALELFKFQIEKEGPYQRFCKSLMINEESVQKWQEIPAVPTLAFKKTKLSDGRVMFLTSGTTTEEKGKHSFPETETYDLAARAHWRAHLPKLPILILGPSPQEAPHSSLTHMFGNLVDGEKSRFLIRDGKFELGGLLQNQEPIILAGTALAFLHFMESHQPILLPAGSQILETGGYKGTARMISKEAFYVQLTDFFKVPDEDIHNEYGMTELSSQAYARGSAGRHRFPHWCRWRVLCAETGIELPVGEIGYLEIHDLANLHSVAAIRTQDFAVDYGDDSFTLLGRDPSALPRGCSRGIDDSLSR